MDGIDEIIDDFSFSILYILNDTGMNMISEKFFGKSVESGLHGGDLYDDIRAIGILFDHIFKTSHLPFNAFEAIEEQLFFVIFSVFMFFAAMIHYLNLFKLRALVTTKSELMHIAAAQIMGTSRIPKAG